MNAIDNIGQDAGVPIYNLDGQEVASDATTAAGGLFSGGLMNNIGYNENGTEYNALVWTGTGPDGGLMDSLLAYRLRRIRFNIFH